MWGLAQQKMGVLFKNVSLQGNQLSVELFLSKTIFLSPPPISASSYLNRSVSLAVCFSGFLADVQTTTWAPDTQCPLLQIFSSCRLSLTSVCHSAFKINNICNFMVFAVYRISECLPALYIFFLTAGVAYVVSTGCPGDIICWVSGIFAALSPLLCPPARWE